jgi:RimJ/RimL family protein N-acetyltransferase
MGPVAAAAKEEIVTLQPNLLRGERVYLSAIDDADLETISDWTENSDYLRLYDTRAAMPQTVADVAAEIRQRQRNENEFVFGVRRCEDELLVGVAGLDGISWTHGVAYLSIGIGEKGHRGQGYGREAISLLMRFAFDELNLHRLCLTVFSYNQAAVALYAGLGFVREGVFREHLHRDGQRYDMILYGILRHEWRNVARVAAP